MRDTTLIFDLDGTLWDATLEISQAWTEVGRSFFGPDYFLSQEQTRTEMGKTMDLIALDISPSGLKKEVQEKFAATCFKAEREFLSKKPGKPYPKSLEIISQLKKMGYRLFVLSNCQLGYIENYLNMVAPSGLFEGSMCFGDTLLPKSGTIKTLIQKFGIANAIYIGDTAGDEVETHKAGLPFLFAAYGFGHSDNYEAIAHSFEEIPEAIRKIEKDFF